MQIHIEFDALREPTVKEMILFYRCLTNDYAAAVELALMRASQPVARADLEALPISEFNRLMTDLAISISAAAAVAANTRASDAAGNLV